MSFLYRVEIFPNQFNLNLHDLRETELKLWFKKYMSVEVDRVFEVKTFLVSSRGPLAHFSENAKIVFSDSVIETVMTSENNDQNDLNAALAIKGFGFPKAVDISYRAGVTDNSAHAALEALKLIPAYAHAEMQVSSGSMYVFEGRNLSSDLLVKMTYEKLANTLLHKVSVVELSERMNHLVFPHVEIEGVGAKTIDLFGSDETLMAMNKDNCWALNKTEIDQIKNYFSEQKRNPTDVEMEIIAQSWSEHCKHKIFSSEITYSENEKTLPVGVKPLGEFKVKSLFKTFIKDATKRIQEERKIPWLVSLFHDNAGIVRFDEFVDVCIKVETHNSPSALDPYGGALTGILGVNRDILGVGTGAKPIANTNVFCLAENHYFSERKIELPDLLKNPDRIKDGVHQGVQDGGNKSGIPTVNGAFVFDRDYVGKPLVYCGTIGVMPQDVNGISTSEKGQRPGDYIVMAGGRIGKDGIHGATFSSMELVDGIPSSVVQIGDPITQKRLSDFLLEARAKGLFNSVTDNGAGGLSSSIGEMAALTNGANVFLEKALVKYPGLSPYELMVSESQERMTFSVAKETIDAFMELAKKRNVEASVVGEFTDHGSLHVTYNGSTVADLSLHFLHESLRPMDLEARYDQTTRADHWLGGLVKNNPLPENNFKEMLFTLLRSPNIRSHEHLIRRYDHEVKGATIVKPFTGKKEKNYSTPTDAGVVWMKPHGGEAHKAISISCGINPKISRFDTYTMAVYAIDEAVRNAVCVGANPEKMVLVDNYCWPDPILSEKNPDGPLKLAELVRASKALFDVSVSYGMPFVSGKDSMKNDFVGKRKNDTVKISVPPTLLITAMGSVDHVDHIVTSELKDEGDLVYLIGEDLKNYQSAFELEYAFDHYEVQYPLPELNTEKQLEIYKTIHKAMIEKLFSSAHDVSDGGLLLSLVEIMLGTNLGLKINLGAEKLQNIFFNESAGRIVVTINPSSQKRFEELFKSYPTLYLGTVTGTETLIVEGVMEVTSKECLANYKYLQGELV